MYIYIYELIFIMEGFSKKTIFYDSFMGCFVADDMIDRNVKSRYISVPIYSEKNIAVLYIKQIDNKRIRRLLLKDIDDKNFIYLFNQKINKLKLYDDYIEFRNNVKRKLAIKWCNENNVKYTKKKRYN